jgi:hypothetical protein
MAQSATGAAVVRVGTAPPRILGSWRGRSNSVLQCYPCTERRHAGDTAVASGSRAWAHEPCARMMCVADPIGVVAKRLLGHNFALRYPGAIYWETSIVLTKFRNSHLASHSSATI